MDRAARRPALPARRVSWLLAAALVLAVLAGGSLYLARGAFSAGPAGPAAVRPVATPASCGGSAAASCAGNLDGVVAAVPPTVASARPRQAAPSAHQTRTGTPSAAASARSPRAAASASAVPPAASGAASAPASAPPAQGGTPAAAVLALINQARAAVGLPALTVTLGLTASSSAHNLTMAGGCGLSHQCPGEPAIGDRETAAGVHWTAAGENIGEGGPVAGTAAAIAQLAVGLTQSMLKEQPPDDGHRMNILSSTFTHIGIAVDRDSAGTVWLTQDFSN
jgi:uncharacterized protein YkwD